jgi:hypothetical protein
MRNQHTLTRVMGLAILISVLLFSPTAGRHANADMGRSPSPHCGGWSIVPNPNPTDYQNKLSAVAAISPTDVWAVGQSQALRGPVVTLIEHWDGTAWSIVSSPIDGSFSVLYGVAAVSSSDVWAVGWGTTGPLIEHWDGTSWQLVNSPRLDGAFMGISAQSATDIWAVGDQLKAGPLTEHWDGTAWHVIHAPGVPSHENQFNAVSALSPTDVWAVGSYVSHGGHALPYTLIEHWDGTSWHIVSSPNVGGFSPLYGVAALSPTNVWAVGNVGDSTLNEHWDGTKWHAISPALNGINNSVVALSSTNIWAAGDADVNFTYVTFTEQWNGTQWQQVPSPSVTATTLSPSYYNYLLGVSASSAQNIWAVGYVLPYLGDATYTLIEHYC